MKFAFIYLHFTRCSTPRKSTAVLNIGPANQSGTQGDSDHLCWCTARTVMTLTGEKSGAGGKLPVASEVFRAGFCFTFRKMLMIESVFLQANIKGISKKKKHVR